MPKRDRKIISYETMQLSLMAISCMKQQYSEYSVARILQDSAMNNNLAIINKTLRRKIPVLGLLFVQTDHRSCQSEGIMRQAANGMSESLRRRQHSCTSHPVLAFQSWASLGYHSKNTHGPFGGLTKPLILKYNPNDFIWASTTGS